MRFDILFFYFQMLKEIELYFLCQGVPEIIQLIEYFEEPDFFYLVFEKAKGGPLLSQIQRRVHFTEHEASTIILNLAAAPPSSIPVRSMLVSVLTPSPSYSIPSTQLEAYKGFLFRIMAVLLVRLIPVE